MKSVRAGVDHARSWVVKVRAWAWVVFAVEVLLLTLTLSMLMVEKIPYHDIQAQLHPEDALDFEEAIQQHATVLTAWIGVALVYLGIGALVMRRLSRIDNRPAHDRDIWESLQLGGIFRGWFPAMVSFAGLSMGLWVMTTSKGKKERSELFEKVVNPEAKETLMGVQWWLDIMIPLAVVCVLLSWTLLHAGYARMYARMCETRWPGALKFPGTERPSLTDYLYFAFCMGATFATSDVEVRAGRMRWHVMVHSVMSFFYNAVVMAIAIKLITEGWG